jgi:hypothetical protein
MGVAHANSAYLKLDGNERNRETQHDENGHADSEARPVDNLERQALQNGAT